MIDNTVFEQILCGVDDLNHFSDNYQYYIDQFYRFLIELLKNKLNITSNKENIKIIVLEVNYETIESYYHPPRNSNILEEVKIALEIDTYNDLGMVKMFQFPKIDFQFDGISFLVSTVCCYDRNMNFKQYSLSEVKVIKHIFY